MSNISKYNKVILTMLNNLGEDAETVCTAFHDKCEGLPCSTCQDCPFYSDESLKEFKESLID